MKPFILILKSLPKFGDMKVNNADQMKGYRKAMIDTEANIRKVFK